MPVPSKDDASSFVPLDGDANPSNFLQPELNAGGALDVIMIRHADGSLSSTELFVVFDSLAAPESVHVTLNGQVWDMGEFSLQATKVHAAAHFLGPSIEAASASTVPPPELLRHLSGSFGHGLIRDGRNEICYHVGSDRVRQCVRAFLYVWDAATPAVVFDIDGTVTLNDIAGQMANFIDGSPTHDGVCEMLCQLHARGYHVVYLTSRPLLGPSGIERTRRFLFQVAVDATGYRMPPAAVVTTTHMSTWSALTSELSGGSKAFKSAALQRIRDAFRPLPLEGSDLTSLPGMHTDGGGLFAGFGNREKDALAYLSAGVPPERIFLIDTSSRIVGRAAVLLSHRMEAGRCSVTGGSRPGTSHGRDGSALDQTPPFAAQALEPAAQPTWQSYQGMIVSMLNHLFPMRCNETTFMHSINQYAALAAAHQHDLSNKQLW
eukprot:CAMPEP_0115833756 /NCGR_PEP_ID=MMETSP0287-20121206/3335_1 /TAXON_ID=412157 /ORGANISM="Chrysochromulina rotalis, Strain UIO044" /LENGTH=433 /DNA_ID=CAMNT_0003287177 /DNA_START=1 /DNA_END=1303 /DNA_ORIENTATION=+